MMDLTIYQQTMRKAESMRQFAGGAPTFQYGEYRAWEKACYREGRTIPPEEFRAWPDDQRHPPARTSATAHKTRYD